MPSRRALSTVIGVSVATTLVADMTTAVLLSPDATAARQAAPRGFVAAALSSRLGQVAPLDKRVTPHILVATRGTLPASAVAKVRGLNGVKVAEVVDAAQAMVANKRVGLLGVEPSTFRAFTPEPTAKSDALWSNVSAGDVAVSFTMGNDGGVRLGSQTQVGGRENQKQVRVGAYATMGIGEIDAVVSRFTAQSLGMPVGNALIVNAPKTDLTKLNRKIRRLLPKQAKSRVLTPQIPRPAGQAGQPGQLPRAGGQVMTAQQTNVAINAARTKLGMPYVWGGESDAEGGYDCSGLVQWSFARAGIRMPRVAADQARTGWRISFDQARPGDLLIWANDPTAPGYISHIAIYIGGGRMLVAPRTGDVVKIAPVYFQNFQGAVRVNPGLAARR